MLGALWILLATIAVGVILYIADRASRSKKGEKDSAESEASASESGVAENGDRNADSSQTETGKDAGAPAAESSECCGLHLVCEKDSLSPMSDEIIYYDDEELDRFIGRAPESYTAEEEEEFRDVLMTLLPQDVAGWARSITLRRIELPGEVRDELLMLVNEQRQAARAH